MQWEWWKEKTRKRKREEKGRKKGIGEEGDAEERFYNAKMHGDVQAMKKGEGGEKAEKKKNKKDLVSLLKFQIESIKIKENIHFYKNVNTLPLPLHSSASTTILACSYSRASSASSLLAGPHPLSARQRLFFVRSPVECDSTELKTFQSNVI